MAHAGDFEEFKQKTVLDLANIENNRETDQSNVNRVDTVVTFTGSKLWLDLELDRSYYFFNFAHSACVKFCYNTNFNQHMEKLTADDQRSEAMACQYNCLSKFAYASSLLQESVKSHPRKVRNQQEFNKIQEEVNRLNEQYTNKKL